MKKKEVIVRVGGTHPSIPFQRLRVKAGLTQEKAAEKLSCGTRTLQRYEAGGATPENTEKNAHLLQLRNRRFDPPG